jgi:Rod binding domain-containing protein
VSGTFNGLFSSADFDLARAREARVLTAGGPSGSSIGRSRLEKAAKEFESILLNQWLEKSREGLASVPGGSGDEDDEIGGGEMINLGLQSISTALTNSGGMGIARFICRELRHEPASSGQSARNPGAGL